MKRFFSYCIVALLIQPQMIQAQTNYFQPHASAIKPLNIGDKVPEIELTNILYHSSPKASLSDFKGKLIILDFWSTNCGPCILGMPKMDSLQKVFGDRIKILPVISLKEINSKQINRIDSFWKSKKHTRNTSLPVVLDTILYKFFTFDGVPFEVWIDGDGVVKGLTTDEYVNVKEITLALEKKTTDWVVNQYKDIDHKQQLLNPTNQGISKNIYYSALLPYLKGIRPHIIFPKDNKLDKATSKRFYAVNAPILELYNRTLIHDKQSGFSFHKKLYVFEFKDSSRFLNIHKEYGDKWLEQNSYCFELILPATTSESQFYECMRQDLNKFFGFRARLEYRKMDCLAIKKIRAPEKKSQHESNNTYNTISGLVRDLNTLSELPIIEEDTITGINIPTSEFDEMKDFNLNEVNKRLSKYGLFLERGERMAKVFVITDL